jgi:hypothetical protein
MNMYSLYKELIGRNDVIVYDQIKSLSEIQSFCLRVPEKEVLTTVFGTKTEEVAGAGSNCVMRGFIIHILLQPNKDDAMGETYSTNGYYKNCVHNFNGRT